MRPPLTRPWALCRLPGPKVSKTADQKIIEEAIKRFKACEEAESRLREQALSDLKFSLGEQWPDEIRRARENDVNGARPCLTVDKLGQYVRQVVNDSRQNKPSIKVRPVDSGADPEVADVMQGVVRHIEDNSRADIAYDSSIEFAVRAGFGYIRVVTDYADEDSFDVDAFIKTVRNPFSTYLDKDAQELDGSDARYGFFFDDMPRESFEAEHPGADACSFDTSATTTHNTWIKEDTVRVCEYFRVEHDEKNHVQIDTGEVFSEEDYWAKFKDAEVRPEIKNSRMIKRRKVMWYKLTANEILDRREFPSRFIPIVPVYGHIIDVAGERRITGLIHNAIDGQRMYNYSVSAYVERVALMPKAPFVAAEGQLEGHESEWAQANTANIPVLQYKVVDLDGNPLPAPQRQPAADVPTGWLQAMQATEHDIQAALGMYNAAVGAPSNEKSGRAIMARQREADNATFHFIDNLSRAIRHVGRILVDMIPRIYDTQRIVRIIGEDGSVESAEFDPDLSAPMIERKDAAGNVINKVYNPTLGKYDVTITVGPAYTTKRQEAADFMSQIAQSNPQLMPLIGDLMFKAMDMPYAEEISERLKLMLPPQIAEHEKAEQQPEQIPPQVQQAMQMAGQQIEQLQGALMQAQQQLEAMSNDKDAEQAKLAIDAQKIQVEQFKAETDRLQVQLEAMRNQQPESMGHEAQESAVLQSLVQRVEQIAQAIAQPAQQPVQVFVDGGQKATVKRSRAVKQEDGSWAMESIEEPVENEVMQ